jgi:hypothetical protein
MKHGVEHICGLWMMGIPVAGPTYVYGDNMSVIHNTQKPDLTLKKKLNFICYKICEAVAMDEIRTGHIHSEENPADIATKVLSGGLKHDHLIAKLLCDIADEHDGKEKADTPH